MAGSGPSAVICARAVAWDAAFDDQPCGLLESDLPGHIGEEATRLKDLAQRPGYSPTQEIVGSRTRYDHSVAEPRIQAMWAEAGIYHFDPAAPAENAYTVDTPPTTVSGLIHIGHVYSYTHADIMIRYHRMLGQRIVYPFGFDDNGLPTELYVERVQGVRARDVGRRAFTQMCLALSEEVERRFEKFWKRLGLSVDWRLRYSTIDPRSQRVSQVSFLDLYRKGLAYRSNAPALWCPQCRTGVAQAEIDDKSSASQFSTLRFSSEAGHELRIATTRPELLPACVAVMVHPDDARFRGMIGKTLRVPLFAQEIAVIADSRADPAKGTGAVMCCTFGDLTDVEWWRDHGLPARIVFAEDGRMNQLAGPYAGLSIKEARTRILDDLAKAGALEAQRGIEHTLGVHERCGTEIEYLMVGQWFIKLLDQKERFVEAGRRIRWHPDYMRMRYENWIQGLHWDWNISRQRYYGIPFPVWYCRSCDEVIVAQPEQLPVDPTDTPPPLRVCPKCGRADFIPDSDVMDTWATSAVTPEICGTLLEPFGIAPADFDRRFRPMSLRPNAHDIIRTWDFYTIVRSLYRHDELPWTDVMISGHGLDPAGKKISKSKLRTSEDPTSVLERFSADAVRYWTAGVRTGSDAVISEESFRNGSRLVTKLWNAARFALPHLEGYRPPEAPPIISNATDRWLLSRLSGVVERATTAMEDYEFTTAKAEVERFFWDDLCDNYLEMVKFRLGGEPGGDLAAPIEKDGVRYALFHALLSVIKMLAPVMPHVTEAIYLEGFRDADGAASIHLSRWPRKNPAWSDRRAARVGAALVAAAVEIRRWKAERRLGLNAVLSGIEVQAPHDLVDELLTSQIDLRSMSRARQVRITSHAEETVLVRISA